MEEGNFAAYDWDDGYYIFKIVGEPYPLENPRGRKPVKVEGCNEVPDGTMVCKGIYWNPVPDAKGWCTPPPGGNRAKKHIFRVQYVLHPKVTMQDPTDEIALPKRYGGKKKEQVMALAPKQILPKHHDVIEHESCHFQTELTNRDCPRGMGEKTITYARLLKKLKSKDLIQNTACLRQCRFFWSIALNCDLMGETAIANVPFSPSSFSFEYSESFPQPANQESSPLQYFVFL